MSCVRCAVIASRATAELAPWAGVKRVVIVGPGASGKSALAACLGEITGLPVIELDKAFWRPGPGRLQSPLSLERVNGFRWSASGGGCAAGRQPGPVSRWGHGVSASG